jgi:hypothetical protein
METIFFAAGLIILVVAFTFYLIVKLAKWKNKRSSYGHSFDFSKMPNKKITKP